MSNSSTGHAALACLALKGDTTLRSHGSLASWHCLHTTKPPRQQACRETEAAACLQPAVGTHRMAAAEVVALVMAARNQAANERIVQLGLLPRLVRLCLDRPHCSPLQVQCLSIIAYALAPVPLNSDPWHV